MPDRFSALSQLLKDGVIQNVYTAAMAQVGLEGELK
jgi:hypothetical protein